MNKFISALFLSVFTVFGANAASISFDASNVSANIGDTITLDVVVDFTSDATVGGGLDIFFDDSILSFQSWSFDSTTMSLDSTFSRSPDLLSNKLEGLAFGSFGGLTTGILGTLSFSTISAGDILISLGVTSDPLKGGDFYSASSYDLQSIDFSSTNIQISTVPVPAAIWLFGSGLIGLLGVARNKV